jgi:signal transduction histidine kinase
VNRLDIARESLIGALVFAVGATAIVRADITMRRSQFQAEARTAHRVLSQATARLDAVLAMLDLMTPIDSGEAGAAERLPALYPQVLAAWRREASAPQAASTGARRTTAMLEAVDGEKAQYTLVLPRAPSASSLRIDARRLASPDEWPWHVDDAVRATLSFRDQVIVLHDVDASMPRPLGLTDGFELTQTLASDSQPFVLHAQRFAGPVEWPWTWLAAWLAACAAGLRAARRWQSARADRRRAAEMLRLAQASRLNMLGELAAGMAHELNQPLTASLAGTQTALRLLRDGTPSHEDSQTAIQALELAGVQARRAAEVVGRLRELVRRQGAQAAMVDTDLREVAHRIVHLLGPELAQRAIDVRIEGQALHAMADPVAVEQILHNLLTNAMHALEASTTGRRRVTITLVAADGRARCAVRDNGPGVTEAQAARLFEPFFTTRTSGLGLGLPLCQTLAMSMDGNLMLEPSSGAGAEFVLELPLARATTTARHEPRVPADPSRG